MLILIAWNMELTQQNMKHAHIQCMLACFALHEWFIKLELDRDRRERVSEHERNNEQITQI